MSETGDLAQTTDANAAVLRLRLQALVSRADTLLLFDLAYLVLQAREADEDRAWPIF